MKKLVKNILITYTGLSLMACSSSEKLKKEEKFETSLNNLKAESMENSIKLTWDKINDENVSKIYFIVKHAYGKKDRIILEKNKTNLDLNTKGNEEVEIYVNLLSNDNKEGKRVKLKARGKMSHLLLNTEDFIETNSNEVKFLFKTNENSNVKIYLGENVNDLKLILEKKLYYWQNGIKISNLEAGKKYYYKIISDYNGNSIESEVNSFYKNKIEEVENAEWAKKSVFYEIFVRSFYDSDGDGTGDFRGIAEKLDYLKDLGIDGLWLMPSFKTNSYHGYDIIDFYEVNKEYGTMEDFEYLLSEAHKKDIKIILDFVINHSSARHKWFEDVSNNENSKYKNYYNWSNEFNNIGENGEWGQIVWHEGKEVFYEGIFSPVMPDLNYRNQELREEMKKAAKFWIDKGVDGFRLDASKHIDSYDKEVTYSWWKEFNSYVKNLNKDFFLVGENWDSSISVIAPFFGTMDSSFNFGLSDMIVDLVNGNKNQNIIKYLNSARKKYKEVNKEFIDSTFLRNHDMPRLASLLNNKEKEKLAASILFTLPGTPFLYYGEELGQKGEKPDEYIREAFDWYKSASGKGMTKRWGENEDYSFTVKDDGISLEEEIGNEDSIYNYFKKLIKIRKENDFIFNTEVEKLDLSRDFLGYKTENENTIIYTIHNLTNNEMNLKNDFSEKYLELISDKKANNNVFTFHPYESIILKIEK